ncbi:MAK10-like protein [Tanacetum coccineum]
MERFENTIFKQREEINGRMTEMFGLLKELTANRTPEKVLIREETKFPVTKNVKSISLTRNGDEENNKTDGTPDNTKMPTETEMPVRKAEAINGSENRTENESIKTHESDEAVEAYGSQPVAYYLKHKINEKLIKGLVNNSGFNNSRSGTRVGKKKGKEYKILHGGPAYDAILKKKITRKEDISGNFKIPCSIGDLKHVNALVDQGSDVNVMPYSTYMKLTNERPAETDIRLSLASHSYIYSLGIVEDVLVEVAEHVYPVDFLVLDIKENEKRPFILGTPFLTIAKASIKFDTGTITLMSGKSKASSGIGGKDKASLGKGNAVQPIEEQKFQKQAPPLFAIKERMDDEGEVTETGTDLKNLMEYFSVNSALFLIQLEVISICFSKLLDGVPKLMHVDFRDFKDPNQHLKDFLKLLDSLDLDGENRIHIHMGGSYYPIPCSILSIGKDQKTLRRYPDVPTTSWRISIRSMDSFQGLTPKSPSSWHRPLAPTGGKLRDLNAEESWALLEDLALYDNESWNDPRDFAKPVKAIALPQDVLSTSDRRLIELENQVQRLMKAHLAPTQPTQVNKITTSCEICSGPHDTQYCMEDPEQAFVEYASSRTDEAGGKWYTFKPEQNNLGDTYNPSWKIHPNLRWRQP